MPNTSRLTSWSGFLSQKNLFEGSPPIYFWHNTVRIIARNCDSKQQRFDLCQCNLAASLSTNGWFKTLPVYNPDTLWFKKKKSARVNTVLMTLLSHSCSRISFSCHKRHNVWLTAFKAPILEPFLVLNFSLWTPVDQLYWSLDESICSPLFTAGNLEDVSVRYIRVISEVFCFTAKDLKDTFFSDSLERHYWLLLLFTRRNW